MTETVPRRRTAAVTWRIATIIARSIVTRGRLIGMVLAGSLVVVVAAVVARSSGSDSDHDGACGGRARLQPVDPGGPRSCSARLRSGT